MPEPLLTCPTCGTDQVIAKEVTAVMVNTSERYRHGVKANDPDAKCCCLECDWDGERRDLKGVQHEDA